jgi:hypothetical protein
MRERLACARCMLRRRRGKHAALIYCALHVAFTCRGLHGAFISCALHVASIYCALQRAFSTRCLRSAVRASRWHAPPICRPIAIIPTPYRGYPYHSCGYPYPYCGYPYPHRDHPYPYFGYACAGWHWPGCRSTRRRRRRRSSARTPGARSTRSAPRRRGPPERTITLPTTPRRLRPTHTVADQCRTCARLRGRHCNGNCCTSGDGTRAPRRRTRASMPCACALRGFALALTVPHRHRDWAHPRPHLHRDWGSNPRPHLRRDSAAGWRRCAAGPPRRRCSAPSGSSVE